MMYYELCIHMMIMYTYDDICIHMMIMRYDYETSPLYNTFKYPFKYIVPVIVKCMQKC